MPFRILHVVRQFAPAIGGLENYVGSMAKHQIALGASCTVLTLDRLFQSDEFRLPALEVVDGIPVNRVSFVGGRKFFVPLGYQRLLASHDVVHVHSTDAFFDLLGVRRPRVTMIATIHGGFFHTRSLASFKRLYLRQVTARTCRAYSYLLANSTNDLEIFQGLHPRVELVPNAVEPIGDFLASGREIMRIMSGNIPDILVM